MYLLSKLLPLFVLPLGISLMLLTWGLVRHKRRLVLLGLGILFLTTQPVVGRFLIRAAEAWAVRPAIAEVGQADAIVVLSAGRNLAPGPDRISELVEANRVLGGIDLFKGGKAPVLIFTAASPDYSGRSEGDALADLACALGVPSGAIFVTGTVRNTADEARETVATLAAARPGAKRILLVTSAFHMPRAREVFSREGFEVLTFPVDFAVSADQRVSVLDVFPSVRALEYSHIALREFYGRAFYWLRATGQRRRALGAAVPTSHPFVDVRPSAAPQLS